MEAVRLGKVGQVAAVKAKILGMPKQTLENWVRLHGKGQLKGAGDKPVSPEQMELARLGAELARARMESDIKKKRWPTSQWNRLEVRLDSQPARRFPFRSLRLLRMVWREYRDLPFLC